MAIYRVWRRYHVFCITGASNLYSLIVGQGLLSLYQVRVEGDVFISSVSSISFLFLFLPCPSLSSPLLLYLLSLFSLSLGDDTQGLTCRSTPTQPFNQSVSQSIYMYRERLSHAASYFKRSSAVIQRAKVLIYL